MAVLSMARSLLHITYCRDWRWEWPGNKARFFCLQNRFRQWRLQNLSGQLMSACVCMCVCVCVCVLCVFICIQLCRLTFPYKLLLICVGLCSSAY